MRLQRIRSRFAGSQQIPRVARKDSKRKTVISTESDRDDNNGYSYRRASIGFRFAAFHAG